MEVKDSTRFKKNIFVTQLDQPNLSDYSNIAVVKDTADRLLLTGKSTLQHTLLLRKELEAEEVDALLAEKRAEFAAKISNCTQRHHEILVRQQALREQTRDAASLVKDQNTKQRRALRRCETDAQERMKLEDELHKLGEIASNELNRRHKLKAKIAGLKKSSDFLLDVVNSLPPDYITARDDPIKGLMDRHAHLASTEKTLAKNTIGLADELRTANDELRSCEINHGYNLLELNGKLEHIRDRYDKLKSRNSTLEAEAGYAHSAYKNRILMAGNALRAVDSLVERCGGANVVMARGKERVQELASKSFEKRNRGVKNPQLIRTKQTALSHSGLDVLLSGIEVAVRSESEVAEDATKRARNSKEITFAKNV